MTSHVFFLNKLADGVAGSDYEKWVREVDYPRARGLQSIEGYTVIRIDGDLREPDAALPADYIEVARVTDLQDYREELAAMPGREEFLAELRGYIGGATAVYGEVIE